MQTQTLKTRESPFFLKTSCPKAFDQREENLIFANSPAVAGSLKFVSFPAGIFQGIPTRTCVMIIIAR
jgi:hypothetical protein